MTLPPDLPKPTWDDPDFVRGIADTLASTGWLAGMLALMLAGVVLGASGAYSALVTLIDGWRLRKVGTLPPGERWDTHRVTANSARKARTRGVVAVAGGGVGVGTYLWLSHHGSAVADIAQGTILGISTNAVPYAAAGLVGAAASAGCAAIARRRLERVPASELPTIQRPNLDRLREPGGAIVHTHDDGTVDQVLVTDGRCRCTVYRPAATVSLDDLPTATLELDPDDPRAGFPLQPGARTAFLADGRPYNPSDDALDLGEWSNDDDDEVWSLAQAIEVHHTIQEHFAAVSCDPAKVLTMPALFDNDEHLTVDFIDAFTEANALQPGDPAHCPAGHAARYITAVQRCEDAWEDAYGNAVELGVSEYTAQQRSNIRKARLALDLALTPTTQAGERAAALTKAYQLLAGLIALPEPLQTRIREAISASEPVPEIAAAR